MSNPEINITDTDLRLMLNQIILEGKDSDKISVDIEELEAAIVFSRDTILPSDAAMDAKFIKQFNSGFPFLFSLKWYLFVIGVIILGTFLFLRSDNKNAGVDKAIIKQASIEPYSPKKESVRSNATPQEYQVINDKKEEKATLPLVLSITNPEAKVDGDYPSYAYTNNNQVNFPVFQENSFLTAEKDSLQFPIDTLFMGITRLELKSLYFPIRVTPDANNYLTIKGRMTIEGERKNPKVSFIIHYTRKGNTLEVEVELVRNSKRQFNSNKFKPEGFLAITLPAFADLKIQNYYGNIEVQGVNGKVCDLYCSYGNIKVSDIDAELTAASNSGDITIQQITGNTTAKSAYGNLSINKVAGNINARCNSGNLVVKEVIGKVIAENLYGYCNLENVSGDLIVKASSGNVDLEKWKGEKCLVDANYGNVNLTDLKGTVAILSKSGIVKAYQVSGNITCTSAYGSQIWSSIEGNLKSKSTSGDIDIDSFIGNLEMQTNYGHVKTQHTKGSMVVNAQSGNIFIKQGNVSDSLILRSSYGDIRLSVINKEEELTYDMEAEYGIISMGSDSSKTDKKSNLYIQKGPVRISCKAKSGNIYVD